MLSGNISYILDIKLIVAVVTSQRLLTIYMTAKITFDST